jgi:hypothetical protein
MLFRWRRHFREGLLDQTGEIAPMLPVSIVPSPGQTPAPAVQPEAQEPACKPAGIEILFEDCTLRVGSTADMKPLRAVLARLRQ